MTAAWRRADGLEAGVAGGAGQAVSLADGGAADDDAGEGEVGVEPFHDLKLLVILLAEVGAGRAHQVEQDRHHGGDAAKVAGAGRSFPARGQGADLDRGRRPRRIDLLEPWGEDEIGAGLGGEPDIVIQVTWVTREIGRVLKLGGIDEDADHGSLVLAG